MTRIWQALGIPSLLALAGCGWLVRDTANVNNSSGFRWDISGVSRSQAGEIRVGDVVTFTATVNGASGPYNVDWDFGGAAQPNKVHLNTENGATTSTTVTLSAQGSFAATVTATDAANPTLVAGPFSFTIGPVLPAPNPGPFIASAIFNAATGTINVVVSDPDLVDANLNVNISTLPAGLNITPATQTIPNGGTAVFQVSPTDILAGATGNVGFIADDGGNGHSVGTSQEITVAVTIAPFPPAADMLYAIPLVTGAAVGDPVTVVVVTGVPANPFQYLNSVGLTIDNDAEYVGWATSGYSSLNVGAVGGAQSDTDGYWLAMAQAAFLLPPDNFIQAVDIGGGRARWDFNLTPLGGFDLTTASGPLFNVQFRFATAGVKTFGFQDVAGVKRTYYSDGALQEFFWGDIANDGSQAPNSVVVF